MRFFIAGPFCGRNSSPAQKQSGLVGIIMKKVAIVTWSNKGFGYEIAKKIAESGAKTILACKNYDEGKAAQSHLNAQGLDVEARVLDCNSTDEFVQEFRKDFKTLDILVNNDGSVLETHKSDQFRLNPTKNLPYKDAITTIWDNLNFPMMMINSFLPLMSSSTSPRIVNVINEIHTYNSVPSLDKARELARRDLSDEDLKLIVQEYITDVFSGEVVNKWPAKPQHVASIFLSAKTRIDSKVYPHVMMNSCVPSTAARVALMQHDLRRSTGKIFGANMQEIKW